MAGEIETRQWGWAVLLASSTTLICCTLPIILVSLGLGAVSAALFANLPFLTVLAQNKAWLFAFAAALIMLSAWLLFRPGRACPTEPRLAEACARAEKWNKRLLTGSAFVWLVGFASAYLALPIMNLIDG